MKITTKFTERSVYGLNNFGDRHRTPIEFVRWLDGEVKEAEEKLEELERNHAELDEVCEQQGFIIALEYVRRFAEGY